MLYNCSLFVFETLQFSSGGRPEGVWLGEGLADMLYVFFRHTGPTQLLNTETDFVALSGGVFL